MRLAKANAKAADRLKSVNSFWRKRTQELCLKGLHPMVGDNLRIDPSTGRRACLACRKIAAKNPPPMKPAMIALVKRELDRGISLSQMTFGRPTGGGAVNPSLKIVDPAVFYHQRRIDPEFDRYALLPKCTPKPLFRKSRSGGWSRRAGFRSGSRSPSVRSFGATEIDEWEADPEGWRAPSAEAAA